MLFLQLKSGEYLTIGEDIAIQVFQDTASRIRVAVKAPREVAVLRGAVWERNGKKRPEGLVPPHGQQRFHPADEPVEIERTLES